MKCFLSCSSRDEDRAIVTWFKELLEAFPDCKVILANDDIAIPIEQVEKCMSECNLACFVVTNREGSASPWILQEVEIARKKNLPLFAFIENGLSSVQLGTLPSYCAYQWYDRSKLIENFPTYVRYIYKARTAALEKLDIDRETLANKAECLRKAVEDLQSSIEIMERWEAGRSFDE